MKKIAAEPEALSKREKQIAELYSDGMSHRDISESLFIAPTTVRTHLRTVYRKLGVSSKVELLRALEAGIKSDRSDETEALSESGDGSSAKPQLGDISDRPTIAVLPFLNLSASEDHDYFADGLTEDIIARLGLLRGAIVTSRTSSFIFKGETTKLSSEISRLLGARYLVEGSVRTSGASVRITAKLVDGKNDRQIWSKRFDRQVADIFALQDEITHQIVESLQIILTDGELTLDPGGTRDIGAWEEFQQGALAHLRYTPHDLRLARTHYANARLRDQTFIDAQVFHAWTFWQEARSGFASDPAANYVKTRKVLDSLLGEGVITSGIMHLEAASRLMEHRFGEALEAANSAIELGPSRLFGYTPASLVFMYCGDFERARDLLREGIRMIPYTPTDIIYNLAGVSGLMGDTSSAVALAEEYMRRMPQDLYAHTALVIAYQAHGATSEAKAQMDRFRRLFPEYCLADFSAHEPFRDERHLEDCLNYLRGAGLPDR